MLTQTGFITTENLDPTSGIATAGSSVQRSSAIDNEGIGIVQVSGTYTGALTAQVTLNGAEWVNVPMRNVSTGAAVAEIPSAAVGIWQFDISGVRGARVSALEAVTGSAGITFTGAKVSNPGTPGDSQVVTGPDGAAIVVSSDPPDSDDTYPTAIIPNGDSLSGAVDLGSGILTRIEMPAAWTAAGLTFQVSADNSTWLDLYDDAGSEVSVTADASQAMRVDFADWIGVRYLKVRSGTSDTAVNQGAERVLTIVTVPR